MPKKPNRKPKPKQVWRVKERKPNWLDLPSDITLNILHRVGAIDILENVQKVCTSWRRICKDPAMWRVVDMDNLGDLFDMPYNLEVMCRHAVDRSEGHLVDINLQYFGTDELVEYIAERSNRLKRLQIGCCYGSVFEIMPSALEKFPLLEELVLDFTEISKEAIEAAGRCCPLLRSFKLNRQGFIGRDADDEEAIAIGENLHALCHLQLIGNNMTDVGLKAILDGCPNLESLDLRRCPSIAFKGDLRKRCSESIKFLKYPDDSLEGYRYDAEYGYFEGLSDDDYDDYAAFDDDDYAAFDYDDFTAYDGYDLDELTELRNALMFFQ